MQDRRDQVQAHMFTMGRLTSGMLRADPDAPESPQGRTNRGIAISVLIAILICAGAFVFGLLKPGTKSSWRDPGTLVVNKDTGTRYLYLGGRLRPVRNYTSAKLLAGDEMTVMSIGGKSLAGTPHGAPVGIPGAPDEAPATGDLDTGPWQVCSGTTTGSIGTTVAVGTEPDGPGLKKEQGLLVTGPDKADYLVWQGRKLRLDETAHAAEALGYGAEQPVKVSAALLNSLPSGPDLTPPEVSGLGEPGKELAGRQTRIGEIYKVTASGAKARYFQLHKEGLAPVTATGAALVLGDPETKQKTYDGGSTAARSLGTDELNGNLAKESELTDRTEGMPEAPPEPVDLESGQTPCVGVRAGGDGTRVSVALTDPADLGPTAQAPTEGLTPACVTVNRIAVRPGRGSLVHALGAGGSDVGATLYLVTDTGMKYRLPSQEGLKALGYTETRAQGLPSSLLSMIPTGPDLTPEAATTGHAKTTAPKCGNERETTEDQRQGNAATTVVSSSSNGSHTVGPVNSLHRFDPQPVVLQKGLTGF
ncbi:type VII secretion protein EccB [Streptomyces tsukubensis]|uniref:Type VII secretion protein EccB n=1 Tax=Streptomyces tsukubensis TaxID=83656 RepID=A0A1V4ABB3_9ACTN|nr:type VII secretion protein EccB [Streptomyces tsukubensis]OON81111.1 type VII secretion protein EccB [Streptomyces tsukubensis]QFR94946.1 type VII secretion protein EccB [Streptomyces tsukubensis]